MMITGVLPTWFKAGVQISVPVAGWIIIPAGAFARRQDSIHLQVVEHWLRYAWLKA